MPTLTLFAGPNGSGKSTIVNYVLKGNPYPYPTGTYYLNADDLEQQLRTKPFCDLRAYRLQSLSLTDWNQFVMESTLTVKICQVKQISVDDLLEYVKLVRGSIIIKAVLLEPDSYLAALIIDFIRYALIRTQQSFAFETVMSHPDKLEIMRLARDAGFTVRLYYITTRDPDINVARVKNRVALGGHPVDEAKIRSRYLGSLDNLAGALRLADEAYLFDNSTDGQNKTKVDDIEVTSIEVARKNGTDLMVTADDVPEWYITYVEEKFLTE
ncbi:hypothetical protein [Spirosoma koreense]